MLAAAVLAPAAALAVTDAERVAVYREYRAAFDAHRYPDALPLAEKLVALTEEQYGANDRELVNPLSNLGTTQYRMGDYRDAEDTYLRSVKIAADTGGGSADRLMLRPLQGLGETYYATRQYEDASVTLQRALDLSRNLDGLLNPGQMTILYPLIGSLVNLARHNPVDRYAHWLEHMARFPSARAEYARELTIAEGAGTRAARLVIDPLLGIARTYRLGAMIGKHQEAVQYADPFAQSGVGAVTEHGLRGLNPARGDALLLAVANN